ncbi:MAG TPA: alpha/beta hydrolase [Streptosporangiaceae bacterium]|nr:alpha/beta hydrolase [Streptosporangiaceae bacterium]
MPDTAVSRSLEAPGARIHYEVSGSGPVLMLIGLPMDSGGFAQVVPLLADRHTVVTYDPRGIGRSTIDDPDQDNTPEVCAADVHRVLAAVTSEPADLLGSSGGAVTGLALLAAHPRQVRTFVAHEPPLSELLADRAERRADVDEIYRTYRTEGQGPAFAKFLALVSGMPLTGQPAPPPEPAPQQPPPSQEQIRMGDRMLAHCLLPTTRYQPDLTALRAASTRIVVGVGKAAPSGLAYRTAVALAGRLGIEPTDFPGSHGGFAEEPGSWAETLQAVLSR